MKYINRNTQTNTT